MIFFLTWNIYQLHNKPLPSSIFWPPCLSLHESLPVAPAKRYNAEELKWSVVSESLAILSGSEEEGKLKRREFFFADISTQ